MTNLHIRFSTDILRRLGEELVTSFDQAVIELVKNAYDADASECIVQLRQDSSVSELVVTDDGEGMTEQEIRSGWLVIGRSQKLPERLTRKKRLLAGSKGLGRIGALRLGESVSLRTRPAAEPGVELSLTIPWTLFDTAALIEDVELVILRDSTDLPSGTEITIQGIRKRVTDREVKKLARELLLLGNPFGAKGEFVPKLVAPGFRQLERLIARGYFEYAELRLRGSIDIHGHAVVEVFDRSGRSRWRTEEGEMSSFPEAPPASFELWIFLLGQPRFGKDGPSSRELSRWLSEVGGVHIYHRGLRVRPYGDPGFDWLDMNLRRVQDPELRPSTNTAIGRITVLDEGQSLEEKTDRSGFIETAAFADLRRFAVESLEWLHEKRMAERVVARRGEAIEASARVAQSRAEVLVAVEKLQAPGPQKVQVQEAVNAFEEASRVEKEIIESDLRLYQTLATVGTVIAVFAHEIDGRSADLLINLKGLKRRLAAAAPRQEGNLDLSEDVDRTIRSADRIARFARIPLGMLRKSKRRATLVDLNATVAAVVETFQPFLEDQSVRCILELSDSGLTTQASVASLESIVSNLLTNAVKAFHRQELDGRDRIIRVRSSSSGSHVTLSIADSGPGIVGFSTERIWAPGVTSDTENGTGLGLTIVRDIVSDLGGTASALAHGDLGGAEFLIQLPSSGAR